MTNITIMICIKNMTCIESYKINLAYNHMAYQTLKGTKNITL